MTLPRAATYLLLVFLISCGDHAGRTPSIGEAYVGPTTLNLRQELAPKSAVAATVKHGDKLDILESKRRFVKVRTAQGAVGWADTHQLLTPEQMAGLRRMAESTSQYPSQGAATAFETLNMHTEPNRTSPSFWQVQDNVKVEVIGHKLSLRTQAISISAPPQPRPQHRKAKPRPSTSKVPPPSPPPAPKPPDNWMALSVPREEALESAHEESAKDPSNVQPAPVGPGPVDDWSLIRTKEGKVGWVLERMLSMAIPDEVAQYAEGHRITSYFPVGEVRDGDSVKNNWLWTTIVKGGQPYEFDSFRVFVWSRKHHRYETAYIERKVVGHYPVHVNTAGSFSLILEGDGGRLYRKNYAFEGFRVRVIGKEAYEPPSLTETPRPTASAAVQSPAKERSWYTRMRDRMSKLLR